MSRTQGLKWKIAPLPPTTHASVELEPWMAYISPVRLGTVTVDHAAPFQWTNAPCEPHDTAQTSFVAEPQTAGKKPPLPFTAVCVVPQALPSKWNIFPCSPL